MDKRMNEIVNLVNLGLDLARDLKGPDGTVFKESGVQVSAKGRGLPNVVTVTYPDGDTYKVTVTKS